MSSSPLIFQDLALEVIAACVIGGSSIRGGEGSVIGAIMGLLIIIITRNIMLLFNVSVYWKELVVGIILIVAVMADSYAIERAKKGLASLMSGEEFE
jgi:ribose transport system permease protein